jgi:hypothetical protein
MGVVHGDLSGLAAAERMLEHFVSAAGGEAAGHPSSDGNNL